MEIIEEICGLCGLNEIEDDNNQWVQCENLTCGRWYHCKCANIDENDIRSSRKFHCGECHFVSYFPQGPYMSSTNKIRASFQMTIGSGYIEDDTDSISMSGRESVVHYMTQLSIADEINLLEIVGRGYYGVVWRGEFKSEPVAVKIFAQIGEASWQRETQIYRTTMLRHRNILGFIAADKRNVLDLMYFWLVIEYQPVGSLYDFLVNNTVTMIDALRMAYGIINGLTFLHTELIGVRKKPAIAHRDLKSRNVLMRNDGTCCLADLGMAVTYSSGSGIVETSSSTRLGTKRYLAPEILESKLNLMDFESVKATDIYAYSLIMWEILRRTCMLDPTQCNESDIHRFNDPDIDLETDTSMYKLPKMFSDSPEPHEVPEMASELERPVTPLMETSKEFSDGSAQHSPLDTHKSQPEAIVDDTADKSLKDPEENVEQTPEGSSDTKQDDTIEKRVKSESESCKLSRDVSEETIKDIGKENIEAGEVPLETEASNTSKDRSRPTEISIEDSTDELAFQCDPYEPPYHGYVPLNPTTAEMYEVVCNLKVRPPLSKRWFRFSPMRSFTGLILECWDEEPRVRLSALRLRKSLAEITGSHYDIDLSLE